MADEMPPPPGGPGQPDRRRPAPTIDLKASEFASEIASAPAAAATGAPEPATAEPPREPSSDRDTEMKMPPKSAVHQSLSGLAAAMSWPPASIALAGAILTLGIVWLLVGAGGNDSRATEARIAQLERQAADLTSRTSAVAADSASASALASRLQKLEAQVAQAVAQTTQVAAAPAPVSDPAQANRIAALEAQLKSLNETVGLLGQRNDRTAAANAAALSELTQKLARPDAPAVESSAASTETANANAALIATLANRLDALEGSAKSTEGALAAEVAKHNAESTDDRTLRTALIAAALAAVVERGRPFAAELKAAQAQAADASVLAPLESFAAAGVPNPGALARELSSLEPALLQAARALPSQAGILEKLQANAERLVRIRPIEEVPGDDPSAVISRIEFKAVHGDLAGALTEFGNLPETVRAPAQGWIAKAQARTAALAASRTFAADALAALAKPAH
jgi:hypothetical protein